LHKNPSSEVDPLCVSIQLVESDVAIDPAGTCVAVGDPEVDTTRTTGAKGVAQLSDQGAPVPLALRLRQQVNVKVRGVLGEIRRQEPFRAVEHVQQAFVWGERATAEGRMGGRQPW